MTGSDRVARRLTALYPPAWRARFPDFEAVLAVSLTEGRPAVVRTALAGAVVEWLRAAGVLPRRAADRARSGVALIGAALVPFTALTLGLGSQLHTGLASGPAGRAGSLHASALALTVGAVVVLLALAALAGAVRGGWRRRAGAVLAAALVVLSATGWAALRSGWYSPAAAALPHRGPGMVATLWVHGVVAAVTPAWVHPTLFARMPAGQVVAALVAPVGVVVAAGALFRLLSSAMPAAPRWPVTVAAAAAVSAMVASVVAAGRWLVDHPGREGTAALAAHADRLAPGHTGWAVVVLLAVMTAVAAVGLRRMSLPA